MAHEDWRARLRQLLAGDRVAFARFSRLVTGTLSGLRAYDFRDEWDDLVQDVIWVVVEAAREGRIRNPDAVAAFVRTTTRQKFRAYLVKAKRIDYSDEMEEVGDPQWTTPRSGQAAANLWEQVRRLPEKQRMVLEAMYREGRTQQETAQHTGIPLGSVKRHLAEGLGTLKKRMASGGI